MKRLISLGYEPEKAESIYLMYRGKGQLHELVDFVALKEAESTRCDQTNEHEYLSF